MSHTSESWEVLVKLKQVFLQYGGCSFHRNYRELMENGQISPAEETYLASKVPTSNVAMLYEKQRLIIRHERVYRDRIKNILGHEFVPKVETARYLSPSSIVNSQHIHLNLYKFLGSNHCKLSIKEGQAKWDKPWETAMRQIICKLTRGSVCHLLCAIIVGQSPGDMYIDIFDPNGSTEAYSGMYMEVSAALSARTGLTCQLPGKQRPNLNKPVHGRGECSVWSILMLDLLSTKGMANFDELLLWIRHVIPKHVLYTIADNYAAWLHKQLR